MYWGLTVKLGLVLRNSHYCRLPVHEAQALWVVHKAWLSRR